MKIFTFLHGTIPYKPNGLVNSVIRRCNVFDKFGVKNTLLVYDWSADCEHNIKRYKQNGNINASVDIKYLYSDLADEDQPPEKRIKHQPDDGDDVAIPDPVKCGIYRCYVNGLYTKYKCFSNDGVLKFIDHLETDFTRKKREFYDLYGYRVKTEYMNKNNSPGTIVYYRRNGQPYLTETKNIKGHVTGYTFFGKDGNKVFSSHNELISFWLLKYVFTSHSLGNENYLISEYAFKRKLLSEISDNLETLKVVYTFHNNHFAAPHKYGSELLPQHRDILNHLNEVDGVVFLTEQQKEDIQKEFGPLNNIFAVPHHAPKLKMNAVNSHTRNKQKIVMLSRFDLYSKRQDEAIKAVSIVKERFPDILFEIYGHGPDEGKIKNLISSMQLDQWVKLKGSTEKPYEVFATAGIMLMPSRFEGQGLTLMEAMTVGCVPIAYKFKYGSEALIEQFDNGIICDHDTPEDLAKNICYLLGNLTELDRLSRNSKTIVEKFSEDRLFSDWMSVFKAIA